MRSLLSFIHKEVLHILRDYRTLLVLFGIPAALLLIFGSAIRTEINNVEIAILDHSKDETTRAIIHKLASSGYFKISGSINSEQEIPKVFEKGLAKQVIVFESDFEYRLNREGKATVQLINDASNPNVATLINSYTSNVLMDYSRNIKLSPTLRRFNISPEVKLLYNPQMKSVYMFVPGLIAMLLMLISALLTSITITREKENGNMEVLLVSPLKPPVIILGKVLPYILLAFINGITILIIAGTVFGVPIHGSLLLLLAEMGLFILTSLSLGILISTVAKVQQVAMFISLVGLLMPTMLLSGFIYPIENMPFWLQYICKVLPATWFLIIIKGIMLKGVGLEYLWKETLILAGMTIFFLIVSMKKLKVRLE